MPTLFDAAVEELRHVHQRLLDGAYTSDITPAVDERQQVLDRFQPIFSHAHLPHLTADEFRSFLPFSANLHWTGLHRQGPRIVEDMDALRSGLQLLLDETQPIAHRYDEGLRHINGMGRGIATAILQIAYPERYGVWNRISEQGLKIVDLWPASVWGEREGSRYERINAILLQLAAALDVTLWVLDALWYYVGIEHKLHDALSEDVIPDADDLDDALPVVAIAPERAATSMQQFALEKYLHEFLFDNWERTELGADWELYREVGNPRAGFKYTVGVGEIDLLARHKRDAKWLVVELKRGRTADETLGQVMRYMGWVRVHMAQPHEEVHGLIVTHEADKKLIYAASIAPTISVRNYRVEFQLQPAIRPEDLS